MKKVLLIISICALGSIVYPQDWQWKYNSITGKFELNYINGTTETKAEFSPTGDIKLAGNIIDANNVPHNLTGIWGVNGTGVYYTGGNVGIGTNNPQEALQLGDNWTFYAQPGDHKVMGVNFKSGMNGDVRIKEEEVAVIRFNRGKIFFQVAGTAPVGSGITYRNAFSIFNNGTCKMQDSLIAGNMKATANISLSRTAFLNIGPWELSQGGAAQPANFYINRWRNGGVGGVKERILYIDSTGKVYAKVIEITNTYPADFVFADDYKLTRITDLQQYISKHRHLPGVPSAEDMKDGIDLAKMNGLLLQKIEELTLYTIELNKRIEELEKKNEQ